MPHIRFMVGNGQRIRFWLDCWCGEQTLCCLFPVVCSLARFKDGMMADYLLVVSNSLVWNIQFTRPVNDWEMKEFTAFIP